MEPMYVAIDKPETRNLFSCFYVSQARALSITPRQYQNVCVLVEFLFAPLSHDELLGLT